MHYAGLFIAQLLVLYVLSYQLQQHLWRFFRIIFRSEYAVMWLMAFLFLPGTLIHELAHLIVARLLLVKAGGLSLIPHNTGDGTIRMGSVTMPKTDPIRHFLIGIAPVYVGIGLVLLILWWSSNHAVFEGWVEWLIVGYTVFQIANSLFASRKDMEGAFGLFVVLAIIVGLAYWLGWRPPVADIVQLVTHYESLFVQAVQWLWIPIGIDLTILALLWPILRLTHR